MVEVYSDYGNLKVKRHVYKLEDLYNCQLSLFEFNNPDALRGYIEENYDWSGVPYDPVYLCRFGNELICYKKEDIYQAMIQYSNNFNGRLLAVAVSGFEFGTGNFGLHRVGSNKAVQRFCIENCLINSANGKFAFKGTTYEINKNNNNNNDTNNKNKININDNSLLRSINKDSRIDYLMIVNSISKDKDFFLKNHHFLDIKKQNEKEEGGKSSFEFFKVLLQNVKDFSEQKKWFNFFIITISQRIYINRIFILDVLNDPKKKKKYPIAKSVAIASKSTDDVSIALMLLIEAAEKKNNMPLRFSYAKAWAFYQCCVIYILRYIATQEKKYLKENDSKQQSKYTLFSSFPQETLAPCYFYLELLKDMRQYFVHSQTYIREVKLLIFEAEKSVKDKTFHVEINDIFQ